eukprot:5463599-Pyramimonas_sp.AAC.1
MARPVRRIETAEIDRSSGGKRFYDRSISIPLRYQLTQGFLDGLLPPPKESKIIWLREPINKFG